GGVVPYRMGNAHPSVFPYEPLPAADTELIVIAANDRQFAKLCAVLEIPEVAQDERFLHNADRTANRDELKPILAERLRTRKAAAAEAPGDCVAPVPHGPGCLEPRLDHAAGPGPRRRRDGLGRLRRARLLAGHPAPAGAR